MTNKNTKSKTKKNKMSKLSTKSTKANTIKHSVAVKPSIIEVMPPSRKSSSRPKMAFDDVYLVFDSLYSAFHAGKDIHDGNVDEHFVALWTLFLITAGYTEDEFWALMDQEHECEHCQTEKVDEETGLTLLEPKPITDKQSN